MRAVLGLAIVTAFAGAGVATSAETASRIVDRTLLCRMTGVGYPDPARILTVGAATYNPGTSDFPSGINVANGAAGSGTGVAVGTGIKRQPYKSYLSHTRATCSVSKVRVPLSRRTLSGGAVQFSTGYKCEAPARVLIRAQAIFEGPPRSFPDGSARGGDLLHGYIAVTTYPDRKPISFSSLNGSSHAAKIFVSQSLCQEDS